MKELTKGNPYKIIILFALPIVFGNILQRIYNMTDSKIVSQYISSGALAAVGATASIQNLLIGFINSLTQGFSILISRSFGSGDSRALKRSVAGTMILTLSFTVFITLCGTVFLNPLLRLLNTPKDIIDLSSDYLRIIILGMIWVSLYNMIANILRAVGDSKRPLICLVISVFLNVGFDLLFICIFKMGIRGAAYATVLAQAISAISSGVFLLKDFKEILPGSQEWRLNKNQYSEMLTTGLSMGMMGFIVNIGSVILQGAINDLGTDKVLAQTTGRKIFDIAMVVIFSLGFSMTTYVSQNIGAGKKKRVREGVKAAIIIDTALTTVLIAISYAFGRPLMRWLASTNDKAIVDNAVIYLQVGVLFFYVLGPLFILRCSLQGLGRKIVPLISSTLEMIMKMLFAFIFVPFFGYMGIVFTEPVSWIVMTIPLIIVYLRVSHNELLED